MKVNDYVKIFLTVIVLSIISETYADTNNKSQNHAEQVEYLSNCIFTQDTKINTKLVIDLSYGMAGKRKLTPLHLGFNPAFILYNQDIYDDKRIDALIKTSGAKGIRFPGGTSANFFDWAAETLDEAAIESIGKKSMLNTVIEHKRINRGKLVKADFSRFEYITSKYDAYRNITLNLYTRDAGYNIKLIETIKSKISSRINWELGNELLNPQYETSYFSKFQWNHRIYLKRAMDIAKHIKEKYPQDRVGIVGGELINERRIQGNAPEKIVEKELEWNNLIAANEYIDAVIFHPYITLADNENWQSKKLQNLNCKKHDIEITKAALEFRWVLGQAQSVPEEYSQYVNKALPNKKIWITESGLLGKGRSEVLSWKSSIIRTLFNLTYYISWIDKMANLDVYMFHLLGYGQGPLHSVYADGSLNSNSMSYKFIEELLDGAENVFVEKYKTKSSLMQLKNNKVLDTIQLVGTETQKGLKFLLINLGSEPATIKLPQNNYCVRSIGGDPFLNISPGQYNNFQDIAKHRLLTNNWDIPGYSVSLIKDCGQDLDK